MLDEGARLSRCCHWVHRAAEALDTHKVSCIDTERWAQMMTASTSSFPRRYIGSVGGQVVWFNNGLPTGIRLAHHHGHGMEQQTICACVQGTRGLFANHGSWSRDAGEPPGASGFWMAILGSSSGEGFVARRYSRVLYGVEYIPPTQTDNGMVGMVESCWLAWWWPRQRTPWPMVEMVSRYLHMYVTYYCTLYIVHSTVV